MSKGSHRRQEDLGKIWDNWDAIFKKEHKEELKDIKEENSEDLPPKDNAK